MEQILDLKKFLQGRSVFDLNKEEREMVSEYIGIMLEGFWTWQLTPLEFKSLIELIVIDIVTALFKLKDDTFSPPEDWRQQTLEILEYARQQLNKPLEEIFDDILLFRNSLWDAIHYGRKAEAEKEGLVRSVIDFLHYGEVIQPSLML